MIIQRNDNILQPFTGFMWDIYTDLYCFTKIEATTKTPKHPNETQ